MAFSDAQWAGYLRHSMPRILARLRGLLLHLSAVCICKRHNSKKHSGPIVRRAATWNISANEAQYTDACIRKLYFRPRWTSNTSLPTYDLLPRFAMAYDIVKTITRNDETVLVNPFINHAKGNPSKIYDYCTDPQRQSKTCIWLCRKKGHSFIAWDVSTEEVEKSGGHSFRLLDSDKWWSRIAFYNCVGARHVQARLPTFKNVTTAKRMSPDQIVF
jgi:hypothetical protein